MATIDSRLAKLERAAPAGQLHPPGVRTVKFEPFRGRNGEWPPGGFDLVELKPRKRPWPIVFETESVRRMSAAREQLKGLPPNEQCQLAKPLGYRLLYSRQP